MTKKVTDPVQCDVELCCKATGELKVEVIKDLKAKDRSLASLLEKRDDENKNAEPK